MKDIASDLNLSKMTISRVLRGQTDVSAATKARVLQRMKELNYRPNVAARNLRSGSTFTIGLIVPSLATPFFAEVAKGLVETLRTAGYGLLISSAEENSETEQFEVGFQLSRQVDALLIASVQESAEFFNDLARQKKPLIMIDRKPPLFSAHFVGVRDRDIGYVAAAHLIKKGCRRVAYLRGPRTAAADLRYSGYRAALNDFNVTFRPDLVVESSETSHLEYKRGADAMRRLLREKVRLDGVMCYSDLLAVGVIDAALEKNLNVPGDLAVVGCGNLLPVQHLRVPLSSVDLVGLEVGQRAARLALRLLSSEKVAPYQQLNLPPRIVIRQSSQSGAE
ncbi:MAG: LacI family DNA-binding transcriptional regulator [Bryocella sp.]